MSPLLFLAKKEGERERKWGENNKPQKSNLPDKCEDATSTGVH